MFSVEYVYVPLMGRAYCTMDYCSSLEIREVESTNEMEMHLLHKAKDLQGKEVSVVSIITIPRQKVSVKVVG